jgi:ribosomal protein L33
VQLLEGHSKLKFLWGISYSSHIKNKYEHHIYSKYCDSMAFLRPTKTARPDGRQQRVRTPTPKSRRFARQLILRDVDGLHNLNCLLQANSKIIINYITSANHRTTRRPEYNKYDSLNPAVTKGDTQAASNYYTQLIT